MLWKNYCSKNEKNLIYVKATVKATTNGLIRYAESEAVSL